MANLEHIKQNKTLQAIDKALEDKNKLRKRRVYLGASQIGEPCHRKLFYNFRNACARNIPAQGLRAIEDGFTQEKVMAERLRMIPQIKLYTENENNEQIGFEMLGFLKGHIDGMILNPIDGSQTEYEIWEHKSCNQTKWNKLKKLIEEKGEKQALQIWDKIYFEQALIYMKAFDKKRHSMTVSTPGGRDYLYCRTEYNNEIAENIIDKARAIIFDNFNIPAKLSENREFFQCKFCEFSAICHDGDFPDVNCSTCRYRDADLKSKKFRCLYKDKDLKNETLSIPCDKHIYNPALIPAKLIEQQQDGCIYETNQGFKFANVFSSGMPELKGVLDAIYPSLDLYKKIKNVNNFSEVAVKIQTNFDGEIVSPKAWEKSSKTFLKL